MNDIFIRNPVRVVKDNKLVDVIELELDFEDIDYILEIIALNGKQIFYGPVTHDTFIDIDVSNEEVEFIYFSKDTNEEIKRYLVKISTEFTIGENELAHREQLMSEEKLYLKLVSEVKEYMDNPKGTEKEIEHHTFMLNKCTMDENARSYVENKIEQYLNKYGTLSQQQIHKFEKRIYADFYGMGILQELDDNNDVGEILVNGFIYPSFRSDIYYILKGQKLEYDKKFKSLNELQNVFSRAIAFSKKELNNLENALIEATRSNRDRVNIIIPDASESYVMNIRKFGNFIPDLDNMKEYGTIDDFSDELMSILVKGKANIGIGGEMGTGKTTFINYLLSYTDKLERKVVIASVSETDVDRVLKGHDLVILNVDDIKGFTFQKLMRASLRTTADRIIVPESRGEEFKTVYEANLKTKGNMFTAHALDDYAFLDMCVDMYNGDNNNADVVSVRNKIAKAVDVIIIMRKVGKSIRIKSVSEIVLDSNKNFEKMNLLYYWDSDKEDNTKGRYIRTTNRLTESFKKRLNEYGVPMSELDEF